MLMPMLWKSAMSSWRATDFIFVVSMPLSNFTTTAFFVLAPYMLVSSVNEFITRNSFQTTTRAVLYLSLS